MTTYDSETLKGFTWLARIGSLLVIVGCCLEATELIIKWGQKPLFRKWVEKNFQKSGRHEVVFFVKFAKAHLIKFETIGFFILCFGLGMELFGSFEAEAIQSNENRRLKEQLNVTAKKASYASAEAALANEHATKFQLEAEQLHGENLKLALDLGKNEASKMDYIQQQSI